MAITIGADDKGKLKILLGLAAALGVLVMVVINPFGIGKKKSGPVDGQIVTGESMPTGPPAPGTRPGGVAAGEAAGAGKPAPTPDAAAAAPADATPTQLVSIKSFRGDPFKPFYSPVIQPPPPPPPIPPALDLPGMKEANISPAELPSFGGQPASAALIQLPPVHIPQGRAKGPTRLGRPKPAGNAEDGGEALRSPNKRMAGVIIGDSVRALIVITSGEETITRVVQPGDEVEGMKILRIERITQDDTLVTRMTVLEGGQERYFDLQPAPVATGAAGGAPAP